MGGKINPQLLTPITGSAAQQAFLESLFGAGMTGSAGISNPLASASGTPSSSGTSTAPSSSGKTTAGGGGTPAFMGVPGYTGQLSPTQNPLLTGAYNSWQPWNAGTEYQANALPQIASQIGPTKMASPGISNMIQFGTPSAVGDYLGNIAQYGAAGPAGMPLANLATGSLGGAASYLSPWLGPGGPTSLYRPPTIFGAPGSAA